MSEHDRCSWSITKPTNFNNRTAPDHVGPSSQSESVMDTYEDRIRAIAVGLFWISLLMPLTVEFYSQEPSPGKHNYSQIMTLMNYCIVVCVMKWFIVRCYSHPLITPDDGNHHSLLVRLDDEMRGVYRTFPLYLLLYFVLEVTRWINLMLTKQWILWSSPSKIGQ